MNTRSDPLLLWPMGKKTPLVSVIIPTYNSGRFIAEAIQSVLEQSYQNHQIIVVDDGSTDTTREVLKKFRHHIKYVYQMNLGPSAARNAGIKIAKGDYICFLDADDLWTANKLEAQMAFMTSHPEIGLFFSDFEEFNGEKTLRKSFLKTKSLYSEIISKIPIENAFNKLLLVNFIPTSTVMVRKHCFLKVGLFDESLRSVEDRDMWLRIAAFFKIACLPLTLSRKRLHDSNISRGRSLAVRSLIKVVEKHSCQFANLVSDTVVKELLADLYFQLSSHQLVENSKMEARQAALDSLRQIVTVRALVLYLLTFLAMPVTHFFLKIKRGLNKQR